MIIYSFSREESKENRFSIKRVDKLAFSQTSVNFLKRAEPLRPKSSYRSQISQEVDSELLRNTFHPEIKWKIV